MVDAAAIVPHVHFDFNSIGAGVAIIIGMEFHVIRHVRIEQRVGQIYHKRRLDTPGRVVDKAAVVFDAGLVTGSIPALIELVDCRVNAAGDLHGTGA